MQTTMIAPRVLGPQDGTSFLLAGNTLTFKIVGAENGVAFTLAEGANEPGGGMASHLHRYEEVAFFVLDGEYSFEIDGRATGLGAGGFAFGPRDLPHSFRNVGPARGRFLLLITPGGLFEQFVAEAGERVAHPGDPLPHAPPDFAHLAAVAAKYGIEFLPPPVSADR